MKNILTSTEKYDELEFFQSIAELVKHAKHNIEKQINAAMIVTYFEIGRRIVEKEQQGAKRAQYGKKVIRGLADYLTAHLGKGYSVENLKLMRRFYVAYSPIGQTVFTQFTPNITWSHYILLTRIDNLEERRFYERVNYAEKN